MPPGSRGTTSSSIRRTIGKRPHQGKKQLRKPITTTVTVKQGVATPFTLTLSVKRPATEGKNQVRPDAKRRRVTSKATGGGKGRKQKDTAGEPTPTEEGETKDKTEKAEQSGTNLTKNPLKETNPKRVVRRVPRVRRPKTDSTTETQSKTKNMEETLVNFADKSNITAAGAILCILLMTCASVLSLCCILVHFGFFAKWRTHPVVHEHNRYEILDSLTQLLPDGWWATSDAFMAVYLPLIMIACAIFVFVKWFDASKSKPMRKSNFDMRVLALLTVPDMLEICTVIVAWQWYDGFLAMYMSTNWSWVMMPWEVVVSSLCLIVAKCLTDYLTGSSNGVATRGVPGNATLRRNQTFGAQYLITLMVIFALARWFPDCVNILRNMAWLQTRVSAYDQERAVKTHNANSMTPGYLNTSMYLSSMSVLKQITHADAKLPYVVENIVSFMNDAGSIVFSYMYILDVPKTALTAHELSRSAAQTAKKLDEERDKIKVPAFQQENNEICARMNIDKDKPPHLVLGYLGVHNWKQVFHLLTSLIYAMTTLTNIWEVGGIDKKKDKETQEDKYKKHIRRTMWCTLGIRVLVIAFKYLLYSALSLIAQRPYSIIGICIFALLVMLKAYFFYGLPSQDDPWHIKVLFRLFRGKKK